jgi:hypothetical protein
MRSTASAERLYLDRLTPNKTLHLTAVARSVFGFNVSPAAPAAELFVQRQRL